MNDPDIIYASIKEYLNIISVIIFFMVIGGIGIHVFLRIRSSRTTDKKE